MDRQVGGAADCRFLRGRRALPCADSAPSTRAQAQFVRSLSKFHNSRFGTSHTESDYFSYHFADVWGCSTEEVRLGSVETMR